MKVIKWYSVNQWGQRRDYVHPDNAGDAQIIRRLTGKATIDGATRELLRDFMGGHGGLEWREVIQPRPGDGPLQAAMREVLAVGGAS